MRIALICAAEIYGELMKKPIKLFAALISGLGATASVFASPNFQRMSGSDLSRMRGDTERVGATMRSVIGRELGHQKVGPKDACGPRAGARPR